MKEKKKKDEFVEDEIQEEVQEEMEEFELDHDDCNCDCDCDCDCEDAECECHHEHCHCHHGEQDSQAEMYLQMAQRLQADFENYRKRVAEQLDYQRQEGVKSVIEVFLPCIDAFGEAKKSINDENVLSGINMIENKIIDALKTLNVEKIASIGEKFNPYLHNVIAVMNDENVENDVILQEFQSGWTYNGKVIRYSKVIVNKKGE